jgi:RNA polymerase sigma-70 factor (ECF subfamily)
LRDPYLRRASPLSAHPELSRLELRIRTETVPFLRTETKTRAAELRRKLAPDDQALLILRVDKDLGWDDIAQILACDVAPSREALVRSSAALRKRFERIKEQLRALAQAEQLIE